MSKLNEWLSARDLYRSLAIPECYEPFENWFMTRIQFALKDPEKRKIEGFRPTQHDLFFVENKDWKVTFENEEADPEFWITQEVYDQVAREEVGMPISRFPRFSHEMAEMGHHERNNPQEYAITDDDKLLD